MRSPTPFNMIMFLVVCTLAMVGFIAVVNGLIGA